MKDIRSVRFNEKIKRASTVGSNGVLALLIAAVSRWYIGTLDLSVALWFLMAVALMFASVQINDLLYSEELE